MPSYDSNRQAIVWHLPWNAVLLSQGLTTYKMHFGHRAQPSGQKLRNKSSGLPPKTTASLSIERALQKRRSLRSHVNLNDNTVGIRLKNAPAFAVQYILSLALMIRYLFDQFAHLIQP